MLPAKEAKENGSRLPNQLRLYSGHFAAMEEPQLLADDLRSWFKQFRGSKKPHRKTLESSDYARR